MRLPRDLTGTELATALKALGYQTTRQTRPSLHTHTMDV